MSLSIIVQLVLGWCGVVVWSWGRSMVMIFLRRSMMIGRGRGVVMVLSWGMVVVRFAWHLLRVLVTGQQVHRTARRQWNLSRVGQYFCRAGMDRIVMRSVVSMIVSCTQRNAHGQQREHYTLHFSLRWLRLLFGRITFTMSTEHVSPLRWIIYIGAAGAWEAM